MAPTFKVYFFSDARARVEVIRLILAAAKVEYEMIDVVFEKDWESVKPTTPFGFLPMMEIDGKKHAEHTALESYLAELYGFNGDSPKERLVIGQLLSLFEAEVAGEGSRFHAPADKKAERTKFLVEEHFPRFLKYFTTFIKDYSNGKDFVLGDKMTVGDLAIYAATTTALQEVPQLAAQFPEVVALRDKVAQVDGLQQYLASRPKCDI